MASSHVEFASSSPFGCALRRDQWRKETNRAADFQNNLNLKDFVIDHFHTCISSKDSDHETSHSHPRPIDPTDLWVGQQRRNNRWGRARQMVSTMMERDNAPTQSHEEIQPNVGIGIGIGGVSSLVQRWRDFAEARKTEAAGSPYYDATSTANSTPIHVHRTASGSRLSSEAWESSAEERYDTPCSSMISTEDSFPDWDSDRSTTTTPIYKTRAPPPPPPTTSTDANNANANANASATATANTNTATSTSSSSAGELKERIRVADIIKKLSVENGITNNNSNNEALPGARLRRTESDPQPEQVVGFFMPVVLNAPRIRGRQAFSDLLMLMERDRHRELQTLGERQAVSKFPQRGRIQSLLRLRALRQSATTDAHQHSNSAATTIGGHQHSNSAASSSTQPAPSSSSTITLLREKFNTKINHEASNMKKPLGHAVNKTTNAEASSTSAHLVREDIQNQVCNTTWKQNTSQVSDLVANRRGNLQEEEATPSSTTTCQRKSHEVSNNLDMQLSSGTVTKTFENGQQSSLQVQNSISFTKMENSSEDSIPTAADVWQRISHEVSNNIDQQQPAPNWREENVISKEQEASNVEILGTNCEWSSDIAHPSHAWEEEEEEEHNEQQLLGTDNDWTGMFSHSRNDWEEQEGDDQQLSETNLDWTYDISRPQSDWEGLRQARYQEMLDPYLDNHEIRQLLQRKSVSSFLSSNLRQSIDQLMMSRVQRRPSPLNHVGGGEEQDINQQEVHQEVVEEEEQEGEREDDDNNHNEEEFEVEEDEQEGNAEEESTSTYSRQSWSRNHDQEISDDYDQVASPSLQQPLSSQSSYHPTTEMQLIYELRGHVERLHHEMFELRRSINSCMSMQVKLRRNIKRDVVAAVSHSVWGEKKQAERKDPKKGVCCICYEMQVDSLLYRCGHMCTCFNCAHELQWSSGKCPICRAPILDVVRAYTDS